MSAVRLIADALCPSTWAFFCIYLLLFPLKQIIYLFISCHLLHALHEHVYALMRRYYCLLRENQALDLT